MHTQKEWTEWRDQLERFLLARFSDRELCRDLAQEALQRLLATQRKQSIQYPRAWLFRTVRNLAVDEIRRRLPSPLGLEASSLLRAPLDEPEEVFLGANGLNLDRDDWLRFLPRAISRLPYHSRRILEAHYTQGVACLELAKQESISLANARVRLHRARRRLQALLVVEAEEAQA